MHIVSPLDSNFDSTDLAFRGRSIVGATLAVALLVVTLAVALLVVPLAVALLVVPLAVALLVMPLAVALLVMPLAVALLVMPLAVALLVPPSKIRNSLFIHINNLLGHRLPVMVLLNICVAILT